MTTGPQIGDRVPGLNNAVYGIMRNNNRAAREYAIRVTGNDTGLGIYVNGVVFRRTARVPEQVRAKNAKKVNLTASRAPCY